jgi:pimeloyl-ACP methyl ester carboxylesterase
MRDQSKPTILCLHGSGTSAAIFEIQARKLARRLSDVFEFVFANGPFQTGPGPGVLPVFRDSGPYYAWVKSSDRIVPKQVAEILETLVQGQIDGGGRPFVGVLAFSEGTKVAAALLLEQERRLLVAAESRRIRDTHDRNGTVGKDGCIDDVSLAFRFGVFIAGTFPPQQFLQSATARELPPYRVTVGVPTVHAIGMQDPWREAGRALCWEFFDKETARLMEFEVGHVVPSREEDVDELAKEILRVYQTTCD